MAGWGTYSTQKDNKADERRHQENNAPRRNLDLRAFLDGTLEEVDRGGMLYAATNGVVDVTHRECVEQRKRINKSRSIKKLQKKKLAACTKERASVVSRRGRRSLLNSGGRRMEAQLDATAA